MRPLMVFACLGTIAGSLVLVPAAQAAGKVIPAEIAQLVDVSERIVLAKVESVEDGPDHKNPDHKIRRARATVKEVWKGPKVETVEYRITPTHYTDNSRNTVRDLRVSDKIAIASADLGRSDRKLPSRPVRPGPSPRMRSQDLFRGSWKGRNGSPRLFRTLPRQPIAV